MSTIVDKHGGIICRKVLANYERIVRAPKPSPAEEYSGLSARTCIGNDRVVSAEAYLRLVLRLESQGKWDHQHASLVRTP